MKEYSVDLHIHTCLSPCAELDMLPTRIIDEAVAKKLDVIAICDHNSAGNVSAVKKAGRNQAVSVLGGMEICSSEEVHILAYFDDDSALAKMQDIVYENLPGENDEDYFGLQLIVDENDKVLGKMEKLLIGSTTLSVEKIVESVHALGGLAVASHVDRDSYSIIAQLGFVPKELSLDGLEVSSRCGDDKIGQFENYGLPLLRSSDAHFPSDIGKASTRLLLNKWSFAEFAMALRGIDQRAIAV